MKAYSISHVTDLLKVPDDRLDACLDELKAMIRVMRLAHVATQQESPDRRINAKEVFPSLTWQDDGTTDVTLTNNGRDMLTIRSGTKE